MVKLDKTFTKVVHNSYWPYETVAGLSTIHEDGFRKVLAGGTSTLNLGNNMNCIQFPCFGLIVMFIIWFYLIALK